MISLYKLLKTINNHDVISWYIEKKDDQNLCIKIENKEKKSVSLSKMRLLDIDVQYLNIPDILFGSIVTIPCSEFQKYCRDLYQISDKVNIYYHNNSSNNDYNVFIMHTTGTYAEQTIQHGEFENDTQSELSHVGEFQLKYLNLFCKSAGLCTSVIIYLQKNIPIILHFAVSDLGSVKFGLSANATVD
jgi:proliferating cell nuclear antigen